MEVVGLSRRSVWLGRLGGGDALGISFVHMPVKVSAQVLGSGNVLYVSRCPEFIPLCVSYICVLVGNRTITLINLVITSANISAHDDEVVQWYWSLRFCSERLPVFVEDHLI